MYMQRKVDISMTVAAHMCSVPIQIYSHNILYIICFPYYIFHIIYNGFYTQIVYHYYYYY